MPTVRLTKSQVDDITKICGVDADRLERIARAIASQPITIKRSVLTRAITNEIGSESAEALERFLFGLATLRRRGITTISALLDSVREGLNSQGWEAGLKQWDASRPIIEQLLNQPSVIATAKALDLSYDFARLCGAIRILTDIRPVYNEQNGHRAEILGASITQTLRVDYFSPQGEESTISVAPDIDDIKHLRDYCDEAIAKAETARRLMEDVVKKPTVIPGEDNE